MPTLGLRNNNADSKVARIWPKNCRQSFWFGSAIHNQSLALDFKISNKSEKQLHPVHSRINAKHLRQHIDQSGFTLSELLVGGLVASLTVTAGLQLSQSIVNNNKQSELNSNAIQLADSTIDQIQQEIRSGERLIAVESDSRMKDCRNYQVPGFNFLFGIVLPAQALNLDDYDMQPGKAPNLKAIKCPIVYGTTVNSVTDGLKLHRIGPDLNKNGYYTSTQISNALILSNIGSATPRGLNDSRTARQACPPSKWNYIQRGGIEVCIDRQFERMAKLSITLNNGRDLSGSSLDDLNARTTQRQGAAMTEIMAFEKRASIGSSSGGHGLCKDPPCSFGGQEITCDKTSFVIDVSGSMGWGGRLQRAKRELLTAIDQCSDEAEINVTAFSSRGYNERTAFKTPQKLTQKNRDELRRLITGLRARGGTNPWPHTDKMMQDPNVKEIVLLSDGGTSYMGFKRLGRYSCGYTYYAHCYRNYNENMRKNNPVTIKTISFGGANYCSTNSRSWRHNWMGMLADLNGGSCIVAA